MLFQTPKLSWDYWLESHDPTYGDTVIIIYCNISIERCTWA